MTTIKFDENLHLKKTHFKTLEEFRLYLVEHKSEELSTEHMAILEERLADLGNNPKADSSMEEVFSQLKRKP